MDNVKNITCLSTLETLILLIEVLFAAAILLSVSPFLTTYSTNGLGAGVVVILVSPPSSFIFTGLTI